MIFQQVSFKSHLIIIFIFFIGISSLDVPQIQSITTNYQYLPSNYGSVAGGTKLYIKAIGLPPTPTDIVIKIGNFVCTHQGANQQTIQCLTPNAQPAPGKYNVQIFVNSQSGISQTQPFSGFTFSYDVTPLLQFVYPSSSTAMTKLYFYGVHRIKNLRSSPQDMGQIYSLKIGDSQCGRFTLEQNPISNPNSFTSIDCIQAYSQQAGKYMVLEHVVPGYALNNYKMRKTSFSDQYYQFVVIPQVQGVTPSTGTTEGNDITIYGTGFSLNPTKLNVTIDGVDCQIQSSTINSINCKIQPKFANDTEKIQTTGNTSQYIKGSGLKYYRYNIGTSIQTTAALKAAIDNGSMASLLQQTKNIYQLQTIQLYGNYQGQAMKGYFKAPVSGNYTFTAVGSTSIALYLNQNYGVPSITDPKPLISTNSGAYYKNFFFDQVNKGNGRNTVNLLEGKYYYMQIYHVNTAGSGWMKISVQVPNNNDTLTWQTHDVVKFETSLINDPQIMSFNVICYQATYTIALLNTTSRKPIVQSTLKRNASLDEFVKALNNFTRFSIYGTTGINRTMYDESGLQTNDSSMAFRFEYMVSIYNYRAQSERNQKFSFINGFTGVFDQIKTKDHSPLMSGTFDLQFTSNNTISNIPYGVTANTLQSKFRSFPGFQKTQVLMRGNPLTGAYWLVDFVGVNYDVADFYFVNNLQGGKIGTTPSITFTEIRKYSPNLLFNPVDYSFLFESSSNYKVLVRSNNILASCGQICDYQFKVNYPEISGFNINQFYLNIQITNPQTSLTLANISKIIFDNQQCKNLIGTFQNVTCQLNKNTDSTPIIRAGLHRPIVKMFQHGYIPYQSQVNSKQFLLTATSITNSTGGTNGGFAAIIKGTGFPLEKSQLTITVCNKNVQIVNVNNIEAQIILPSCNEGKKDVNVVYGNCIETVSINQVNICSNKTQFQYLSRLNPIFQIHSISPISSSPVLKKIMNITGSGFGVIPANIKVHLTNNSGKVYQMRVVFINDTFIQCGIPGGLPGKFAVSVSKLNLGYATPNPINCNQFTYQLLVNNIVPNSGSHYGGTLITVQGKNFSPYELQNLVFIGTQLNQFCEIEKFNETHIQCRTPVRNQYYKNASNEVFVSSKLIQDSKCSCNFTYIDQSASPLIISHNAQQRIKPGQIITIQGSNLDQVNTKISLKNQNTFKTTVVSTQFVQNGTYTFEVPNIQAGSYQLKARIDPIGQSNGVKVLIQLSASGLQYNQISLLGGEITVLGYSLPNGWPNAQFKTSLISAGQYKVINVINSTSSLLKLSIPSVKSDTSYSLIIQDEFKVQKIYNFSQKLTKTPKLTLLSSKNVSSLVNESITLNKSNLPSFNPISVKMYSLIDKSVQYEIANLISNTNNITFNVNLKPGGYGFKVFYKQFGFANIEDSIKVTNSTPYSISSSLTMSYNGGYLQIAGQNINRGAQIQVQGFYGSIVQQQTNQTHALFKIPPLVTFQTYANYSTLTKVKTINALQYNITSDMSNPNSQEKALRVFDSKFTSEYISTNNNCFISLDMGPKRILHLDNVRIFPAKQWVIVYQHLKNAIIQGSNDYSSWDTLITIDQTIHSGWNILKPNSSQNIKGYRFYRFSHTNQSKCQLAQLQFNGLEFSNHLISSIGSDKVDIIFRDGAIQQTFISSLQFKQSITPIVNSIVPYATGAVFGNQSITILGNFPTLINLFNTKVIIDDVKCIVTGVSFTQINCTTGKKDINKTQIQRAFQVSIDNKIAINKADYKYVLKWSDIRTWGTDLFPVDGDLVYVPKEMTLYVDISTPSLLALIVEGTIIFADQNDMVIQAGFITINGGKFIAGTQQKPYQHKLKFLLHGNYYGKQQPMFGNKGIGCFQCDFSMYGKPKAYTWTQLSQTARIGSTSIIVEDLIDWEANDRIVIASTGFDHNQAQQRFITSVVGKTIYFSQPLKYNHVSSVQTYGTHDLVMKAEVGMYTRNIIVTGDQDSKQNQYGAHLMFTGKSQNGLKGQVAYSQFTQCGQPKIIGRYCIHYHMVGDAMNSYALGNAVHHSYARVITIHGTHYLRVKYNVGYQVKGHNFFLEDGIQTNNVLEYNLAIKSLQSWTMLQSDISVASFWITNPYNHLKHNHAAGGDFYGFWYQIKKNPDGPSATTDICPQGYPLGESHDNVAHSYKRFGLRLFVLASRQNPCQKVNNATHKQNPAMPSNPSIQSKFYNYMLYRNKEAGLLHQYAAHVVYQNFTIAESIQGNMQFYQTRGGVQLFVNTQVRNSAIIGYTNYSQANDQAAKNLVKATIGILAPRGDNFNISGVDFYNFGTQSRIIQTCAKCSPIKFTNEAWEFFISKITYTNINGKYLHFNGLQKTIIYDQDGSYSNKVFDGITRANATITKYYKHLSVQTNCINPTNLTQWHDAILCDQNITIRKVSIAFPQPSFYFMFQPMKLQLLDFPEYIVPQNSTNYSETYSNFGGMESMIDQKFVYSWPMVTGRHYQAWWHTGLQFSQCTIWFSKYYQSADENIVIKFNHTIFRQFYEVQRSERLGTKQLEIGYSGFNINNCTNGEFNHDNNISIVYYCVSNYGRIIQPTYINLYAIYCHYVCPDPTMEFLRQNFTRLWSQPLNWPNQECPKAGENATVEGKWTMFLDINPPCLDILIIDGVLLVQNSKTFTDFKICANIIWIRAGKLKIGNESDAYSHPFTIQLRGEKNSKDLVITPQAGGNKILAVTGSLQIYGSYNGNPSTRLIQTAFAGQTKISVQNCVGWKIGDQIAISPSFSQYQQFQKVTIASINGNKVQFQPALKYTHFGATGLTVNNNYGTLDTRSVVAHLTRNIKIVSGGPDQNWGYHLLSYAFFDDEKNMFRQGDISLIGVQLKSGGQYNSQKSTLHVVNTQHYDRGQRNLIYKSSFHDCKARCINIEQAKSFTIDNNVFYNAIQVHIQTQSIQQFTITNNVMIGAIKRPDFYFKQLVACYSGCRAKQSIVNDKLKMENNICHGSVGHGYLLPMLPCSQIDLNPFKNNQAGSCEVGFLFQKSQGQCSASSNVKAFACKIAHMAHPYGTTQVLHKNIMAVDCQRGITLRFGSSSSVDNTAQLRNSYINMISRPNCSYCYGNSAIKCSNNQGIRLLTVTINGQSAPASFGSGFDVICKIQQLDAKAFLYGNTFENFNLNYSELSQCQNNIIFRPHSSASDQVGSHHLWNTTVINSSIQAYGRFDPPSSNELGWFGGCGNILCTGKNNYLIRDYDGTFLPERGILIANNSQIGIKLGCTYYTYMNGYYCMRSDLGILQYEAIPAMHSRIMWPVQLKYDGGDWKTLTNGYKQWQWDGNQPLNKRFARFLSIIQYSKVYNMSFAGTPPQDMWFQFQKRTPTGNPQDWIIIKIYYPFPNSIRVEHKDTRQVIRPITLLSNSTQTSLLQLSNECGANKYFYKNYTIHFVLTGSSSCKLRVTLTNSIQLTTHFKIDIQQFYIADGKTKYIDRLAALLGIEDTSRIKIVGIYNGSTQVVAQIQQNSTINGQQAHPLNNSFVQQIKQLGKKLQQLINSGQFNTEMIIHGLGPIISSSLKINILESTKDTFIQPTQTADEKPPEMSQGIIIGIVGGGLAIIAIIIILIALYLRKKSARIAQQDIVPQISKNIFRENEANITQQSIRQEKDFENEIKQKSGNLNY